MEEMEFNEVRRTLTGFDGVWKRVSGRPDNDGDRTGGDRPGGGTDMTLRSFIGDELDLSRDLSSLARMTRDNSERNQLFRLASQARQRADRLRAEAFIRTGDIDDSSADGKSSCHRLRALREAMNDASDLSRDYRAADRNTCDDVLSCLYDQFAEQTDAAADQLRCMIVNCFT